MPGGAGESQLQRELGPALGQVRVREAELEGLEYVLQEHVDLLGAANRPRGARDVLVGPHGLAQPKMNEYLLNLQRIIEHSFFHDDIIHSFFKNFGNQGYVSENVMNDLDTQMFLNFS